MLHNTRPREEINVTSGHTGNLAVEGACFMLLTEIQKGRGKTDSMEQGIPKCTQHCREGCLLGSLAPHFRKQGNVGVAFQRWTDRAGKGCSFRYPGACPCRALWIKGSTWNWAGKQTGRHVSCRNIEVLRSLQLVPISSWHNLSTVCLCMKL